MICHGDHTERAKGAICFVGFAQRSSVMRRLGDGGGSSLSGGGLSGCRLPSPGIFSARKTVAHRPNLRSDDEPLSVVLSQCGHAIHFKCWMSWAGTVDVNR